MILSSYPLWWLALPVLLLPVWWHRQKRQRLKAEPLATARFLPSATPEQLRVWQWRDKVLLVLRCLMLVALIAWLAATIFPWRGDTVLVDAGADKAWAEKEIAAAGFGAASRMDLPADALQWLRQNERDWRPAAKLLIIARADQIAMPPRVPQFSHQLELRTQRPAAARITQNASPPGSRPGPAAQQASPVGPQVAPVVLGVPAARSGAWRSLFAAFDSAGTSAVRYTLAAEPNAGTTLIVWDTQDTAPPANWRAPHWWIAATPAAFPELAKASTLTINGITLKYADSPRGRLWTSDAFPPRDADTARAFYEAWQLLAAAPAPAYAPPSQTFAAARNTPPAITDAKPATWLALALLALFMIERILTHARRH
ncbi:BatA domain-containing protein [Duganella sp. PWIR1]